MGFAKTNLYPPDLKFVSKCSKVFSHPERLSILQTRCSEGPLTVEEIVQRSPLSRATISQHLRILRQNDLIEYEESIPFIHYQVNNQNLKKHIGQINKYFESLRA